MAYTENKIRAGPINGTQKDILVEFMKQHEDLQSGKFTREFTFKKAQNLWNEIAEQLNAVPGGARKEWKMWRKVSCMCKKFSICSLIFFILDMAGFKKKCEIEGFER